VYASFIIVSLSLYIAYRYIGRFTGVLMLFCCRLSCLQYVTDRIGLASPSTMSFWCPDIAPDTVSTHSRCLETRLQCDRSDVMMAFKILNFNRRRVLNISLWLADFPWSASDLRLTCDHFVGKLSTMGQPTRPTQPSIPPWLVNE